MGMATRWAEFMEHNGPIQVDDYRVGDCFGEESQVHFEAKLEIQHWMHRAMDNTPEDAYVWVEWLYPWNRLKRGKKFSWAAEARVFGAEEWLDVNWIHVPTAEAAIQHKYLPKFVFDLACETDAGLHAVIEVVCGNPTEPEKRAFCRSLDIPLYEIDADKFAPQFADRDKFTYAKREYTGAPRLELPLVGGGHITLADLYHAVFPRTAK